MRPTPVRVDQGEQPPAELAEFVRIIDETGLGAQGIHLHQEGRADLEVRWRCDDPIHVFSCSKTFTCLAFGILQGQGGIGLDTRLVDVVEPQGPVADGAGDITMGHLLTMTSGSSSTVFTEEEKLAVDMAGQFYAAPLRHAPGEVFEYSNGSTYMLGRAVAAVAGQSVRDYLLPTLFEPLGILNPLWATCRAGHSLGAYGLHLRTDELARMGRLLLQRGEWAGRQLVPSDWVDAMHTDWVDTGHDDPEAARYGLGVWDCTPDGIWRADGNRGQFVVVAPEQRAVVTVTSHEEFAMYDVLRAVWDGVLPELG